VVGEMQGSDEIMNSTLFLGTYPGLTKAMLKREIEVIVKFVGP
jgi:CDP-6-deoxy-D-xylo-4-hexulose-3-dehydrase